MGFSGILMAFNGILVEFEIGFHGIEWDFNGIEPGKWGVIAGFDETLWWWMAK